MKESSHLMTSSILVSQSVKMVNQSKFPNILTWVIIKMTMNDFKDSHFTLSIKELPHITVSAASHQSIKTLF